MNQNNTEMINKPNDDPALTAAAGYAPSAHEKQVMVGMLREASEIIAHDDWDYSDLGCIQRRLAYVVNRLPTNEYISHTK